MSTATAYDPATFDTRRSRLAVWTAAWFAAVISLLSIGLIIAGFDGAWQPTFVCFLPMAFLFAAYSHRETREYVKLLEARVSRLEAALAARDS